MKKPPKQPEEDQLFDLEQNLQDNLYSKSDLEEDFFPPNLSPEEFKKLWNKQKNETKHAQSEEHTNANYKQQQEQIEAEPRKETPVTAQTNSKNEFLKALEHSLTELNSKKDYKQSRLKERGETENLTESIVRVIRIPLSKNMEDELITIRRLLNELYQMKKPREVIDDYQVILALLNWASKQLEVNTLNLPEEDKVSQQDKQLKDS